MKKLMFVCHGAGNGGAERVITSLANEFSVHNSVVLITTKNEEKIYDLYPNVTHITINTNSNFKLFRLVNRISSLRKEIKKIKPDCIISFSAIPNIQVLSASYFLKHKIIISERTDPTRYPTSKIGKLLRLITYFFADTVVFQTEEAMHYFPKYITKKSTIIKNPISRNLPDVFQGKRIKKIVGVGSLGEQKDWITAIKAFELFSQVFPDYKFYIYGEGPEKEYLSTYIKTNSNLNNKVFLMGFNSHVVSEINDATMYISSSKYEGISNAMLEALATGVPCICTDCPVGGAREFIKHGYNGYLIPVGDFSELSKYMKKLADNDNLQRDFSKNSVKIRTSLQIDNIVNVWNREIDKLC